MLKKTKKKTLVSAAYIDVVVEYLDELENNAGKGVDPENCGMCDAMHIDYGRKYICEYCPLGETGGVRYCDDRFAHLKNKYGDSVNFYSYATKKSTLKRVRWIAKKVNTYTYNWAGWVIHTK